MAPRPLKLNHHHHHHHSHNHNHQLIKRKRKRNLSFQDQALFYLKRDAERVVVVGERGLRPLTTMSQDVPHPTTPTSATTTTTTTQPELKPKEEEEAGGGEEGGAEGVRGRRKLENADSSYDSDFDPKEDESHGDVCRTVSDTLGAEFEEYVTKFSPHMSTPTCPVTSTSAICTTSSSSSSVVSPLASVTTTTTAATVTTTTTTTAATTTTTATATPESTSVSTAKDTTPTTTTTTTTTTLPATTTTTTTTTTTKDTTTTTTTSLTLPKLTLTQPQTQETEVVEKRGVSQAADSTGTTLTTTTTTTTPTTTTATSVSVHNKPTYASQVEFGIKLGYSETLVQLALIKLGATPDKDDLLAELIRLGNVNLPGGGGTGGGGAGGEEEDTASTGLHGALHQEQPSPTSPLRPVVIDGSNVAMSHGNKTTFSCRGLRLCVDWFRTRGHNEITVFVPAWRKEAPRWDSPIQDQDVLLELERERVLVFTPSRVCGGKRIVSYDDRYILNEAVQNGGVVVSNDNYRDLAAENPGFRRVVEENLLMYSWVNGRFVPPDDPLGRTGPTLDVFLRRGTSRDKDKQAPCPYGRKCTYGNKCKYKHPERGAAPLKSVTEWLQEQAQRHYQNKAKSRDSSPGEGLRGSLSLPVCPPEDVSKKPLTRTQSIVPTVSLTLPSALTQDTPTHDSPTTPSHHHLRPPPQDPLRSMYKSDPALYPMYAAPGSYWGWDGGQGGGVGHYGSHLPLGKQQTDPEPQDNPHRKLQRQLTLNPSFDSRLYKMHGFREPAPEHFPLTPPPAPPQGPAPQTQGQGSPSRVGRPAEGAVFTPGQGRASPGYSSGGYGSREQVPGGLHPPLARHSSQDSSKHLASLPPHLYPSYSHPHVTRFASAPDPIWGGPHQPAPTPPLITRLNSTSDTRLNLYGDHHYFDVYEDPAGRPASYAMPQGHVTPAPGPVGSRPMSPQSTALHHSPSVSPRGHTPPQQAPASAPPTAPTGFPPPGHEDARLRVFYHLSQLFPEAQVRAVMTQHPEEADPQTIISYILAAAGQAGSRPMSPQQSPQPTSPYLLQAFPAPAPAPAPSPAPASHEDARLRAFYHLSQLFPEAEVRAVLARAPEETDTRQLCAALLARRASHPS